MQYRTFGRLPVEVSDIGFGAWQIGGAWVEVTEADGRAAHFYTVVVRDTVDQDYAAHRQRFLAEQGYGYIITDADDLLGPAV